MSSTVAEQRESFLQQHGLLQIYAYYRVAIALALLGVFSSDMGRGSIGNDAPTLYLYTVVAYALLNVGWLLQLRRNAYQADAGMVTLILGCDIPVFLLLIQASGGLGSGLGYLLIINCSVGALLLDRRMGAFLAAVASTGIIGQQLYKLATDSADAEDVVSAGGLGIMLFAAVSGLQYLAGMVRTANYRAEQQTREAAQAQRLAQQIVERMRTGVLVLGSGNKIRLVNNAAQRLRGSEDTDLETQLFNALANWRQNPEQSSAVIGNPGTTELRLSFAPLQSQDRESALVFLEDNRKLTQEAQKLKLASLGRLTGSIAHEVRNPLGAISHAAQLLMESANVTEEDRHLAAIICRHSERVNQIVENVLRLSRGRAATPRENELGIWLEQFVAEYRVGAPGQARLEVVLPDDPVIARFDGEQFAQVMTNLCNNALRYSERATGSADVKIAVRQVASQGCAVVDVVDYGEGVAPELRDQIFEPFFTTGHGGNGLGLYLARELCEANQASLIYCHDADGNSCFRVELPLA